MFLGGVRRGLSFRTPGGAAARADRDDAVAVPRGARGAHGADGPSRSPCSRAAYASLMVLDPIAARRAEAPLYFARLRPPQMAIATASLAALLAVALIG